MLPNTLDEDSKVVKLHDSQAMIQIINANTTYCAWQRAGGKTGGGIGPRFLHLSEVMPKSQVILFSDTFKRLKERIVPNIIEFLQNKLGLIEDIDFVKYKKPPENWDKPIIPLDVYENVISFSSGMALCLVSLHAEGSANAYNAQAAIGDEVKFCDESKINNEVLPALRGSADLFGHLPEYLSVWMFTDKYGPKIKWYLKKREKVNKKAVDIVYTLQMEMFKLLDQMKEYKSNSNLSGYYRVKKIYDDYKTKADRLRKNMIYFSDMKPYENKAAVGDFYFRRQKRICKSEMEYDVAILNKDPDKVESCFYATFSKRNKYQVEPGQDYNPDLPFYTAFDYNYAICPMPLVQVSKLPESIYTTVNFIDALFTLHPLGIEDTIDLFCNKYQLHRKKEIHYIFDHTAIGRNPLKTTYRSEVVKRFELHGWMVIEHYTNDAPDHDIKHKLMKRLFTESGEHAIMVNEVTCEHMIRSMELSPAVISGGKTKKDKSTETMEGWPAEDAPHFGDAFDMIIWGLFEWNIIQVHNYVSIHISIN